MKRLLKLQFRNVFHNKLFYVCLGLSLLLGPVLSIVLSLTLSNMFQTGNGIDQKVLPQIISFLGSELGLVSIIYIALFSCLDFNEGTTKNIIARGYTKKQLLFSKYIVSIISLFTMYLVTCLILFIVYIKNGIGFESVLLLQLLVYIIGIIATTIFYSTISFISEKNSAAIIVCLFIPQIISFAIAAIETQTKLSISKYWIDNVSATFKSKPTISNMIFPVVCYLVYIVVIPIIGSKIIKNKEIK